MNNTYKAEKVKKDIKISEYLIQNTLKLGT